MNAPSDQPLPLADAGRPVSQQVGKAATSAKSRVQAFVLAVAGLILGVALGSLFGLPTQRIALMGDAPEGAQRSQGAAATNTVGALGRLMPEGDITTLAPPFASGDARVARLLVREGERITKGQLVAELDNLPQRLAQRATATAELAAKQAALNQARSAARLSLAEALAGSERARAARQAADQDLMRLSELAKVGMATRPQLDQAQLMVAQAAADQARASATIHRNSGRDALEQPDVQLAIKNVEVAKAALAQAEQDLAGARVTAPLDATVLAVHVRVGEKPGDRGIATLGNIDRMAAELEVYQTDIRSIALGQTVVLTAPSLDAPLSGVVSHIGLEVMRQSVLAADPVASVDARVVRVRVALDGPSSERSRGLSGLQVIGKIARGRP